ncbi:MAG: hypothetical protein ABW321_11745 [Polyangiales bacterium]
MWKWLCLLPIAQLTVVNPLQAQPQPEPDPQAQRAPIQQEPAKPDHAEQDAQEPHDDPEPPPLDGDVFGGRSGGLRVGFLQFGFLTQIRFVRTWAADSRNASAVYRVAENELARNGDGLSLHRFALRLAADPSPYLRLKTILDLAELVHDNADAAIKQAYVEVRPIPKRLELAIGLFKLPFTILELDPTAEFPFSNLGRADDLIKDLGFAGRDIGALVTFAPLKKAKRLRIAVGVFRGHARDESQAVLGTLGGRIEWRPIKGLRIGADWVEHPSNIVYNQSIETDDDDLVLNPTDLRYPRAQTWLAGRAFSADVQYQRHKMRLQIEGILGDRVDRDARYGAESFYILWALASYRFKTGSLHWMPALRAVYWDADREHSVGVRRELSVALNVDFTDNVRLLIDLTRIDVQAGTPLLDQPTPLPETPYQQLDDTQLIASLQVVL